MPIRMARLEDIPALVEGGRRMHALTRFKHFDYLPEKVARSFEAIILDQRNKYIFMVAESAAGEIVGALIGVLERHIFSDALIASVIHFDVLPEKRMGRHALKLMLAFEAWAERTSALEISFGQNSAEAPKDVSSFDRLLRRQGYKLCGANYFRSTHN